MKYSILLLVLALTACVSIEMKTETPSTTQVFITSTLPPTRVVSPTPVQSATAKTPPAAATPGKTDSNCDDRALLLEDVTIPDNTALQPGSPFTKTWRFENGGTCSWHGYSIAFLAGDRMEAPDSSPVPETAPGQTVDISIDMLAPSLDGLFTGYYELRSSDGKVVPIGVEKSFWVRIVIGAGGPLTPSVPFTAAPLITPGGPLSCDYFLGQTYQNEVASLINSARSEAGLPTLQVNAQLAAAAQDHSIDMACFGLLSHSGSDASSSYERLVRAAAHVPDLMRVLGVVGAATATTPAREERAAHDERGDAAHVHAVS
jgi:hypothetical protein